MELGTVVCVHAKDMKEPWCLAASTTTQTAQQLMTTYAKRWGIEAGFRDTKDLRFGMGMASIRVSTPELVYGNTGIPDFQQLRRELGPRKSPRVDRWRGDAAQERAEEHSR